MSRPGCCFANLIKLDPSTGAVIWKRRIPGDGLLEKPRVFRVEPLRGTNDVLVSMESSLGGNYGTICRVDASGDQVWSYSYTTAFGGRDYRPVCANGNGIIGLENRVMGSNGTQIVLMTIGTQSYLTGLNYSGNLSWVASVVAINQTLYANASIVVSASGALYGNSDLNGAGTLFNPSTGVIVSHSPQFLGTSTLGNVRPTAVEQSSGQFLLTGTPTRKCSSAYTVAATGPGTYVAKIARWGASGISYSNMTTGWGLLDASLSQVWTGASVLGVTPSKINDCENDSTGAYFSSAQMSNAVNVWKANSTGAIVWAQTCEFIAPTASASSLALSEEGYLFVGGGGSI